ncbi:MAG: HIT family protein [bacterium]
MREDCIFCSIIEKVIASKIVYEDDLVMAILDIDPVSEAHTLVVPKRHFDDIVSIESEYVERIAEVTQKIAKKIFENIKPDGINILQNNGRAAGQVVMHYHNHIIPRWENDGNKVFNSQPPEKDLFSMMDETLAKIKI